VILSLSAFANDKGVGMDELAKALSDNITQIAEDVKVMSSEIKGMKRDRRGIKQGTSDLKKPKERGFHNKI
jgi:hypothetical protein